MEDLKQKYLEGCKETEITLQKYKRELTDEEQKQLDCIIDNQIEDMKIKRDEQK